MQKTSDCVKNEDKCSHAIAPSLPPRILNNRPLHSYTKTSEWDWISKGIFPLVTATGNVYID